MKASKRILLGVMVTVVFCSLLMRYGYVSIISTKDVKLPENRIHISSHKDASNTGYIFQSTMGVFKSYNPMRYSEGSKNARGETTPEQKILQNKLNQWLNKILYMHEQFTYKTLDSCNNTCAFEPEICQATSLKKWNKILDSDKLKAVPLYTDNEYIFPWEKEYLKDPPLQDTKLLPDLEISKIYYLRNGRHVNYGKKFQCQKNDRLVFRADLIDGYGNPRTRGGDEVRTWISDVTGSRSMSGFVTDLGNGSYLATVTPKWTGVVKLNVAVVYPREYLRAALYHMKEGRHRFIYGLYKRDDVEEVTICHPTPNIPGRPCVCNYTAWNRRPYYCGRPFDSRLSCKDWVGVYSAKGPTENKLTVAEAEMDSKMSRKLEDATINDNIDIEVVENDQPTQELPRCRTLDRRITWDMKSPRGYWVGKKTWNSLVCKEPPLIKHRVESCFKNTQMWLIGDSNLNKINNELKRIIELSPDDDLPWSMEQVHINNELRITNTFRGHEYPLFHYKTGEWRDLWKQRGIEDFFKKIPSNGNHVVVIHYNLHFAISHLSAIFQRFLAVREAVWDLLTRNPYILVAIRGPHISSVEWERNHIFGGDVQGSFILSMLHDVFEDLKDRVVFLDGWDMTISFQNEEFHPPKPIAFAMLRTLLAFNCS